jgi:lactam utilization protein B
MPAALSNGNGSHNASLLSKIEINVDCGEAFGQWEGGPDEELMPMIDAANVACGGHAGDPVTMRKTVHLAKKHGIKVGARESESPEYESRLTSRPRVPR